MALLTKAIKGTQDALPGDIHKLLYLENVVREAAENCGFHEIRTPVFEHTELFQRSVGDTTDVVQKEMYTFEDKGGRSITLRPEGTAGAARSVLEHGLLNEALPQKVYYLTSCYRYEKPQAGRLREFHQFGIECYGPADAAADAEVISVTSDIFARLGLQNIRLEINSIGCPECRATYLDALKAYFTEHLDSLCDTCKDRLDRNPMRILDCKNPACKEVTAKAPSILDYLCEACDAHFTQVQAYLDAGKIAYKVNPQIVRGLDYYTRTVFEFLTSDLGAQSAVCAGGRYDGLIEEIGGKPTPALGFAMGMERLLLLMEAQEIEFPPAETCDIYFANIGDAAHIKAYALAHSLHEAGYGAQVDLLGRGLKAQMKYANKIHAKYTAVIGDDDLKNDQVQVKNMETGEQETIRLSEFSEEFEQLMLKAAFSDLAGSIALEDI